MCFQLIILYLDNLCKPSVFHQDFDMKCACLTFLIHIDYHQKYPHEGADVSDSAIPKMVVSLLRHIMGLMSKACDPEKLNAVTKFAYIFWEKILIIMN